MLISRDAILIAGDEGDNFYVIDQGEVEVSLRRQGIIAITTVDVTYKIDKCVKYNMGLHYIMSLFLIAFNIIRIAIGR